jgi:hypothetical protein
MTASTISIQVDQNSIRMGGMVRVTASVPDRAGLLLLPYVNGRRWGAHERPDADGKAVFHIPLPNPGPARIEVAAARLLPGWMGQDDPDLLLAGRPLPAELPRSSAVQVEVTWRSFPPREPGASLFCMQWEGWFVRGLDSWRSAHAVPLMGFFDSTNRDMLRQHFLWMMEEGVDCLLSDWTNHLWGKQHWDERPDTTNAINHATMMALEVLAEMRDEGHPVPKMILFPGISNGKPTTMQALNEWLAWIYHTLVRNPRFAGLWQEFDGKPLIGILDTGAVGDPRGTAESAFRIPFFKHTLEMSAAELDAHRAAQPPVDERHFTVRWISSQNQATLHHKLGYWSWMDGVSDPPVTYKDGTAEAVTVSSAFFNALGWTGPLANGRRGGATYMETLKPALAARPRMIFLHQWNEFAGQAEGHGMGEQHDIYADSYSVELSDDIEPVSLTAPGYRGDPGGWGFTYHNLTRALIDLYRGQDGGSTLLAVSSPLDGASVQSDTLAVRWTWLGKAPAGFDLRLDGWLIHEALQGDGVDLPLTGLAAGNHTLEVSARGAVTRYPLSKDRPDEPLEQPQATTVRVRFSVNY